MRFLDVTNTARFSAARPFVGEMRGVIRRTLSLCPESDVEVLSKELLDRFIAEGLVEASDWSEDLVYSLVLTEVDLMWAHAEVA